MSAAQPKARKRFPGLNAAVLQHPYDRAALGALQRVPGLDLVVRKFIELFPERVAYILNYKMMLVTAVNHPLTIVRAREIFNWSDSREYRDILEGTYAHAKSPAEDLSRDTAVSNASPPPRYTANGLIRCPHCNREQTNRRFCSLCGGAIS